MYHLRTAAAFRPQGVFASPGIIPNENTHQDDLNADGHHCVEDEKRRPGYGQSGRLGTLHEGIVLHFSSTLVAKKGPTDNGIIK